MTERRDGLLPNMQARVWADGKTVSYRWKPDGKPWVPLGTDLEAAIKRVLALRRGDPTAGTLAWLWGEYRQNSPKWARLSPGSRADYELAWSQIESRLGHMPVAAITAKVIARYVHVERAGSPRRADIEKTVLSNLFKRGILIGACDRNPAIEVEPHGSEASTVLPNDLALERFLTWLEQQTPQRRVIGRMAEFASLAGSRRCEFLSITWRQVDRDAGVVRTVRAKQRGKKREQVVEVIAITPPLAALLDRIRAEGDADCPYLFTTRDGNPYNDRGFKTLWQRSRASALAAKVINGDERFTFHSLRAFYATKHKRQFGSLPDLHANPAVTAGVYDRSREVPRSALK